MSRENSQEIKLNLIEELEDIIEEEGDKIDYDYKLPKFKKITSKTIGSAESLGDRKVDEEDLDEDSLRVMLEEQKKEIEKEKKVVNPPTHVKTEKVSQKEKKEIEKNHSAIDPQEFQKVHNEFSKMNVFLKKILSNSEEDKKSNNDLLILEKLEKINDLEEKILSINENVINSDNVAVKKKENSLKLFLKEYQLTAEGYEKKVKEIEKETSNIVKRMVEKVIAIEIANRSEKIIEANIKSIFSELSEADNIKLHLNKEDVGNFKDIEYLSKVEIIEDDLVLKGDYSLTSSKGNYNQKIKEKVNLILSAMELI
jgi:hypothetical protein